MDEKEHPKQPIKTKGEVSSESKKSITATNNKVSLKSKISPKMIAIFSGIAIAVIALVIIVVNASKPSYEEYDLKGLTIKEACEKARSAGWEVDRVIAREGSDKTDCFNTDLTVSYYDYYDYDKSVTIYFGEKKTDEEKQAECEASGKWYRDGQCKSQEEWENDYKWKEAHAACKKYGPNAYAKTLTDCYLGNDYQGPVNGSSTDESQASASDSSSSSSSANSSWKQLLSEYEAWVNDYVDFMKKYNNTSDTSAKMAMLGDYSRLVDEMTAWSQKVENMKGSLSNSDLTEYIQTVNRVNQKLNELY